MRRKPGDFNRYSDVLQAGRPGFDFRQGHQIYLNSTVSRPALRPTQPPTQWASWALSLGLKWSRSEANHLPPSSAEVKNGGVVPPLSHSSSWRGAELICTELSFCLYFTNVRELFGK
jgi:hypothetical protein